MIHDAQTETLEEVKRILIKGGFGSSSQDYS